MDVSAEAAKRTRRARVLHPCFAAYDNLGEQVANASLGPLFAGAGLDIDLVDHDLRNVHEPDRLDRRIDEINSDFDLLLIGPAGMLGAGPIGSIFSQPDAWRRLTLPVAMIGVGIVASVTRPVWHTAMPETSIMVQALRRADLASVRDLTSQLLAARSRGPDQTPPYLTGCPSLWTARPLNPPAVEYDLALNLSLVHEVCRNHVPELLDLLRALKATGRRVLWVNHSAADDDLARGANLRLDLGFDVVRPHNGAEAGAAYGRCAAAVVTRLHAGLFSLANDVPFGFIGYDVKCWDLMAMLSDEPYQYVLPLDRLAELDVPRELDRLLKRLDANIASLKQAQSLLKQHFRSQTDRAMADLGALLSHGRKPAQT